MEGSAAWLLLLFQVRRHNHTAQPPADSLWHPLHVGYFSSCETNRHKTISTVRRAAGCNAAYRYGTPAQLELQCPGAVAQGIEQFRFAHDSHRRRCGTRCVCRAIHGPLMSHHGARACVATATMHSMAASAT